MANNENDLGWLGIAWEVVQYVLAAVGTAASAGAIWVARRYVGDRAMLLRHEELLKDIDEKLGMFLAFKKLAEAGPFGEDLEGLLAAGDERMQALQESDEATNDRISELQRESEVSHAEIRGELQTLNSNIDWIKQAIIRIEKK